MQRRVQQLLSAWDSTFGSWSFTWLGKKTSEVSIIRTPACLLSPISSVMQHRCFRIVATSVWSVKNTRQQQGQTALLICRSADCLNPRPALLLCFTGSLAPWHRRKGERGQEAKEAHWKAEDIPAKPLKTDSSPATSIHDRHMTSSTAGKRMLCATASHESIPRTNAAPETL